MPFQPGNSFGGRRPGAGRKPGGVHAERRRLFSETINDDQIRGIAELMAHRARAGDARAAALVLAYTCGVPAPAGQELYNEARAKQALAEAANARLDNRRLRIEIARAEQALERERRELELYFAQFVTAERVQQLFSAFAQRGLAQLAQLTQAQLTEYAADPAGAERLRSDVAGALAAAAAAAAAELAIDAGAAGDVDVIESAYAPEGDSSEEE